MSTRDMLTAIPPEHSFASVVSIPLSLAIVFGGFWCLKAAIRLVRKPPPPAQGALRQPESGRAVGGWGVQSWRT